MDVWMTVSALAGSMANFLIEQRYVEESERQKLIDQYVDWVRRKEHREQVGLLQELKALSDSALVQLSGLQALIESVHNEIKKSQEHIKERNVAQQVHDLVLEAVRLHVESELERAGKRLRGEVRGQRFDSFRLIGSLMTGTTYPVWQVFGETYPSLKNLFTKHDQVIQALNDRLNAIVVRSLPDGELLAIHRRSDQKYDHRLVVECLINDMVEHVDEHLKRLSGELKERFQTVNREDLNAINTCRVELHSLDSTIWELINEVRVELIKAHGIKAMRPVENRSLPPSSTGLSADFGFTGL